MKMKKENKILSAAKRGFTLVELLVVVAIIGILGGVAVVNIVDHVENSRVTATEMSVNNVDTAVAAYSLKHNGRAPSNLQDLVNNDSEKYLKRDDDLIDAWGTELKIETKKNGKEWVIISAGPDEQFGTDDDIRSDKGSKKKKRD